MKFVNYFIFWKDMHHYGLSRAIEHTLEMGFDAVEPLACYDLPPLFASLQEAREAKGALDREGLSVSCYSMLTDLNASDREAALREVLFNVDCAAALGSPYFHHTLIPSYTYPTPPLRYDEALERIAVSADRIASRCAEHGMTCLYEPQGLYFNGVKGLSSLLERMKQTHSNVGICGDVGNSLFVDVPATDIFAALAGEIRHIHVKDYTVSDPDGSDRSDRSLSGKLLRPAIPGEGVTDLAKLFSYLQDYKGDISMEFACDDDTMRASIAYVKGLLG